MEHKPESTESKKRNILEMEDFSIETERLLLRPVSLQDAPEIYSEFDSEVARYMSPPVPKEVSDTEEFVKSSINGFLSGEEIVVAILNKETLEYLGNGGIHHIDTKAPELGIWIKKSAHGNHYGREAVLGLKQWADSHLDYDYLLYPVAQENISSRKIAESLGGREYSVKASQNGAGVSMNMVEYRIYKQ